MIPEFDYKTFIEEYQSPVYPLTKDKILDNYLFKKECRSSIKFYQTDQKLTSDDEEYVFDDNDKLIPVSAIQKPKRLPSRYDNRSINNSKFGAIPVTMRQVELQQPRSGRYSLSGKKNYNFLRNKDLIELQRYFQQNQLSKEELCQIFNVSISSMTRFYRNFVQKGKITLRRKQRPKQNQYNYEARIMAQSIRTIMRNDPSVTIKQVHQILKTNLRQELNLNQIRTIMSDIKSGICQA